MRHSDFRTDVVTARLREPAVMVVTRVGVVARDQHPWAGVDGTRT